MHCNQIIRLIKIADAEMHSSQATHQQLPVQHRPKISWNGAATQHQESLGARRSPIVTEDLKLPVPAQEMEGIPAHVVRESESPDRARKSDFGLTGAYFRTGTCGNTHASKHITNIETSVTTLCTSSSHPPKFDRARKRRCLAPVMKY
jgi:hypothetical protein